MAFMAGAIVSKLTLDRGQWNQSVQSIQKDQTKMQSFASKSGQTFGKMAKTIAIAGGAIAGTLAVMIKKTMETGDWIDKMSLRTGFSATTLSELAHAADICGASLTDIERSVKKMALSITQANEGLESYDRAFRRIGLSSKELVKMDIETQFLTIAEAIAEVEDPTVRAATAQEIFGRAGTALLPLMAEGKEGLKDLREEAHRLGIVFDQESAKKAAEFKDSLTRLSRSFQGMSQSIVIELLPALTNIAQAFTDLMVNVRQNAGGISKAVLTFVKLTVQGIGGLIMAFHALKIGVFAVGEEVVRHLAKLTMGVVIVTGYTKKIGVMSSVHDQAKDALKDLIVVGMSYKKGMEDEINTTTDIVIAIEDFIRQLNEADISLASTIDWLKKGEGAQKSYKEQLADTELPASRLTREMNYMVRAFGDSIGKTVESSDVIREWSAQFGMSALEFQLGVIKMATLWMGFAGPTIQAGCDRILASVKGTTEQVTYNWQTAIASITELLWQLDAIFNQIYQNEMQRIENEYNERRAWIEQNIEDETERAEMMDALEKEMDEKRREARRSAAQANKAIAIVNAIINTAEAVTKALTAAPPPFNYILAAAVAIAGAIQVALIRAQPIPAKEGLIATGETIIKAGENESELISPLSKLPELMEPIMTRKFGRGEIPVVQLSPTTIELKLDSRSVAKGVLKYAYELTRDGTVKIHTRSFVSV